MPSFTAELEAVEAEVSVNNEYTPARVSDSPSAVGYNGKVYVFHQGPDNNGQLFYTIYDGDGKSKGSTRVENVGLSCAPAAVVFNSRIYVFYQGGSNNGQLMYNTFNGSSWAGETRVGDMGMGKSPGAVVWRDQIWVFWQARADIFYKSLNAGGEWRDRQQAPGETRESPALFVLNDRLYLCYQRGINLYWNRFNGGNWESEREVERHIISIATPPGIAVANGTAHFFCISSKGGGGMEKITFDGDNFNISQVVREVSGKFTPGAVAHDGVFYVFYHHGGENFHQIWRFMMDIE